MKTAVFRMAGMFAIGCSVMLTGCVSTPPASSPIVERRALEAFDMEGRIAASDGARAANGRIVWHHASHTDGWTVFTPLGQIAAQLTSTQDGAQLITADGKRLEGKDTDSMLSQLLGVSAPVDGLPYWVQAVPRQGATVSRYDALQRPVRISDSGWIIDYTAYDGDTPEALPRRLEAHRGDARIRLIIDQWTPLH